MGLQFCDGRVAGLALRSQTQIREPHHANLTFEFSRFTECCSRVLRCLSNNPNRIPRDNVCAKQPCLETTIVGLEDDRADVAAVATDITRLIQRETETAVAAPTTPKPLIREDDLRAPARPCYKSSTTP